MNNDISKKDSLARSKKTAVSLSDILVEEGAGLLMPGGKIGYKAIKTLVKHIKSWREDFIKCRLEDFHEQVISGIPPEKQKEFLEHKFSVDDYYSLLRHVTEDEENEKVKVYAKLFQGLILNQIPAKLKLHLIKSIRELKYSDFKLMRQVYINEKVEFEAPGNKWNQIMRLTGFPERDPIKCHSIQTLIRLGFLYAEDGNKPPWPTDLLKFIVEFLYDKNYLTAESLSKTAP